MKDTIDEISEELWSQMIEAIEAKLSEFGVPYEKESAVKSEVANNIVNRLENNLIVVEG